MNEEIIEVFKGTAFNVCESQQLQLLKGTKMGVKINPDATPKRMMRPIPCPINLREKSKEGFAGRGEIKKIEPVQQNGAQPSWISPALFVLKSSGVCGRVINFKALNTECERQPNHTSDVLKLASQIPTVLDRSINVLLFIF